MFPQVRWEDFRRGLCLLDPYGLNLRWEVIATAGRMGTIDLFLNFPIMDANRNALWRNPERVAPDQAARFTTFWGDESWRDVVYRPSAQRRLFGNDEIEKQSNEAVAEAFRQRLASAGGFKNVPTPIPMRNAQGAVVYYLFFASQREVPGKIVRGIFKKYEKRRG